MGIWLGNRFLDTRHRPVNTDLDFTGLPFPSDMVLWVTGGALALGVM